MDKAKAAITDFMGRSGHHDTTVHEAVAPAVTQETIKPHVHEEVNTAIDKEVHQDHYHRTVQPVKDREVLPEKHEAKIGAVQHREFDHRDHDTTKRNLVADQAQFKDERRVEATSHSQSVAPVVGGEHVHHHIHETIQPVVQKETIQPSVVHTTVPIHEVHHNKATHHETTALPAMTMDQFKAKGGSLSGREERYDEFEGVPKNIGSSTAGGIGAVAGLSHKEGHHSKDHARHGDYDGTPNHHSHAGIEQGGLTTNSTTSGHSHGTANPLDRNNDGRVDARDAGAAGHSGTSHTGVHQGTDGVIGGTRNGSDRLAHRDNEDGSLPRALTEDKSHFEPHHSTTTNSHEAGAHKKPSLMDKV
ncbi:hypothetical protein J1614_009444 [Plenodomus biglobosus]|nr:hypothetical protein J1614_009444 [Plenodomus biglobosus]